MPRKLPHEYSTDPRAVRARERAKANPEKERAKWTKANAQRKASGYYGKHKADYARRGAIRAKKLKQEIFNHYGTSCACCGEKSRWFLSIDHVNGGGRAHEREIGSTLYHWLKKNNFPAGFQTLCFNCNFAKWNLGLCPHKLKKAVQRVSP